MNYVQIYIHLKCNLWCYDELLNSLDDFNLYVLTSFISVSLMTKVGFKNAVTFAKTVFLERKPTHRISLGNDVAKKS